MGIFQHCRFKKKIDIVENSIIKLYSEKEVDNSTQAICVFTNYNQLILKLKHSTLGLTGEVIINSKQDWGL